MNADARPYFLIWYSMVYACFWMPLATLIIPAALLVFRKTRGFAPTTG